jgi:hypothetical protein
MSRRWLIATVTIVALGVAGCAGLRSERSGRDVGRAVCDVRNASSADEAQRALTKLNNKLNDAQRITGRPVAQDVNNIQNNLNDLVNHVSDKQSTLAHQDVESILRNVVQAADQSSGLTKRYYQGVAEGLGDCT